MSAEIEQLRMQLADHGETITRLETEIERLRAVLQWIVDRYETAAEDGWPAEDMRTYARRALEPKP